MTCWSAQSCEARNVHSTNVMRQIIYCYLTAVSICISPSLQQGWGGLGGYLYESVMKGVCNSRTPCFWHDWASTSAVMQCRASPSSTVACGECSTHPSPCPSPRTAHTGSSRAFSRGSNPLCRPSPPTLRMSRRLGPPRPPPRACWRAWNRKVRSTLRSRTPSLDQELNLQNTDKEDYWGV